MKNWYEATVPVGHTHTKNGKHIYAPIYIKARNIVKAEDKIKNIPAVGGNKTAQRIKMMNDKPDDEYITNPWYGYSQKFKDALNA